VFNDSSAKPSRVAIEAAKAFKACRGGDELGTCGEYLGVKGAKGVRTLAEGPRFALIKRKTKTRAAHREGAQTGIEGNQGLNSVSRGTTKPNVIAVCKDDDS
jgi:hypothetical protein